MTVLEARQEPQPMTDRDRIDTAKNRCAIVFESMQLTPEEIAVVTEEINEAANMLIDDDDDREIKIQLTGTDTTIRKGLPAEEVL